ncbi:MAG: serine/threonine protein kinase [Chlamydiia bacterium]|nr:serine/threonine protein kinase [Chlamydiia bacterium]
MNNGCSDLLKMDLKSIGDYRIETFYREGGMSLTYLASHPDHSSLVVIKILKNRSANDPFAVARFLREAEILSHADHPNIVRLYECGQVEDMRFIAMEYFAGIALKEFIEHTLFSLPRALALLLEIAYAICHLHTHGMVHRDLKPENILIDDAFQIRLIDFGVARRIREGEGKGNLPPPQFVGTPVYMSPEQQKNSEHVSFPSDIYTLAIIAYELLTGRLCHGKIHLSNVPKSLQPILARALQPEIEERYQDIVDFIADLSDALNAIQVLPYVSGKEAQCGLIETVQEIQARRLYITPSSDSQQGGQVAPALMIYPSHDISGVYIEGFHGSDPKTSVWVFADSPAKGIDGLVLLAELKGRLEPLRRGREWEEWLRQIEDLNLSMGTRWPDALSLFVLCLDCRKHELNWTAIGDGGIYFRLSKNAGFSPLTQVQNHVGGGERAVAVGGKEPFPPGAMVLLHTHALLAQAMAEPTDADLSNLLSVLNDSSHLTPHQLQQKVLAKIPREVPFVRSGCPIALFSLVHQEQLV